METLSSSLDLVMSLYRYFKPPEGNSQLCPAAVKDADKAVGMQLNAKPVSKSRGDDAKFILRSSPTEASHCPCIHGNL